MNLELAIQHGRARSASLSAERLINCYPQQSPSQSKAPVWLVGIPAPLAFFTAGSGPIRGFDVMGGIAYVVSGTSLYSFNSGGTGLSIGTIPGTGAVTMANNGTQLAICANSTGYIYTTAGGLAAIADADFPSVTSVAFLDGYFIWSVTSSDQFVWSALDNGTAYDALDFATAETSSDNLVRVFVDHRELWLFGEKTTEVWFNDGATPFQRVPQAIIQKGLANRNAVAQLDNTIYWLDHEGIVRKAGPGYVPQRVSTHEIENSLLEGDLTTARAWSHTFEGHEFFVLTIPAKGTFVFDAATGLWHERIISGQTYWPYDFSVNVYGKWLTGSALDGVVYELDPDTYTADSTMVFPPIYADGRRFTLHGVQMDMDKTSTTSVTLETSADGASWSNASSATIGGSGYVNQIRWFRLGQYRNCHLRFKITSQSVKRGIFAAHADLTVDRS